MRRATIRWSLLAAAAILAAPGLARLLGALPAPDGGPRVSPLTSANVVLGIVLLIVSLVAAAVIGAIASRASDERTGLAAAGFALLGPAWQSGTVVDMLRRSDAPGAYWSLAFEGVLVLIGVGAIALVCRIASRGRAAPAARAPGASGASGASGAPAALLAMTVCFAVGAVVSWIVARETLKGQTIGAAAIGALAGAAAARVAAPSAPLFALPFGVAMLAVLGPAAGAVLHGSEALRDAYELTLIPLARPMPLDWAVGALLGTPIGAAWGASMVEKRAVRTA